MTTFHYMDESERYRHGEFETYDEALHAAMSIVDGDLTHLYRKGMTAEEPYRQYTTFGNDPFIVPAFRFSAWSYARERCRVICEEASQSDSPS